MIRSLLSTLPLFSLLNPLAVAQTEEALATQHRLQAREKGSPWLSSRLLTPHLTVQDPERSKQFYQQAFGFALRDEVVKQGTAVHVEMSYRGELVLMFVPAEKSLHAEDVPFNPADIAQQKRYFYLYVSNVDDVTEKARKAGATVLQAPHQSAWGDRFALVADPDGYLWGLAQSATLSW
ncbi:VOC family protein [Serratia microhaemolytica]|uniref:VOC family protein n=1 Tax=Serratia microhaemolytica TaxID=2675110 RepID=UPI000FDDA683|nr:VOC family protein [Serratia microhaemolytica]